MNITELKELAEKATPGPWKHRNGRIFQLDYEALTIANVARAFDGDYSPANGELLAAANPAAILELIAHLEDAQGEIRALRATEAGLRERVKELQFGLSEVEKLMDESYGVAGLHLNGDVAPWSELRSGGRFETWLLGFDEALALLEKKE